MRATARSASRSEPASRTRRTPPPARAPRSLAHPTRTSSAHPRTSAAIARGSTAHHCRLALLLVTAGHGVGSRKLRPRQGCPRPSGAQASTNHAGSCGGRSADQPRGAVSTASSTVRARSIVVAGSLAVTTAGNTVPPRRGRSPGSAPRRRWRTSSRCLTGPSHCPARCARGASRSPRGAGRIDPAPSWRHTRTCDSRGVGCPARPRRWSAAVRGILRPRRRT